MVGTDPNATRADETLGFIIFEAGHGTLDDLEYEAAVTPDAIDGVMGVDPSHDAMFAIPFEGTPDVVVTSIAGEDSDNGDGGWSVLWGDDSLTAEGFSVAIDEYLGENRGHDAEAVGYIALYQRCVGDDEPCTTGVGACAQEGTFVCGQEGLSCEAEPGDPTEEICNAVDDDCNGAVDDAVVDAGQDCEFGMGACTRTGTLLCDAPAAASLTTWYTFDEPTFAGHVPDLVEGSTHLGLLENGATLTEEGAGLFGGRALAAGASGWVAPLSPETYDFQAAFTWSLWIKGTDNSGALISRNPAGTRWNRGSKALFVRGATIQFDTGWVSNPQTGVDVTDDQWHHVAVTWDPAGGETRFNMYVDGVLSHTSTHNVGAYAESNVSNGGQAQTGLFIGQANFSGGLSSLDKYNGLIDEVAIWTQALTAQQIAALAAGGRPVAALVCDAQPGEPAADDATCDGIDDDCDGEIDEDADPCD